jgi:hypothetical protein
VAEGEAPGEERDRRSRQDDTEEEKDDHAYS